MPTTRLLPHRTALCWLSLFLPGILSSFDRSPAAPGDAAPASAVQVIQVLDQTIDWYRNLGLQQETVSRPSDLLILYDNRQTADQVVRLAFEIARTDAAAIAARTEAANAGDAATSPQVLQPLTAKLDAQQQAIEAELAADKKRAGNLSRAGRDASAAKIAELQGELDLVNTKKSILTGMSEFVAGTGSLVGTSSALKAQIDAMAAALPSAGLENPDVTSTGAAAAAPASAVRTGPAAPSAAVNRSIAPDRFGLWDLGAEVLRLHQKIGTVELVDRRTGELQNTLKIMRMPLLEQMKVLSAEGDALASEADTADGKTLNDVRDRLNLLSSQFKQASALFIPLSKETLLLSQYRRNLGTWRATVRNEYVDAWKTLGVRIFILLIVLALIFAGADLWRRAVLKYVHDARRRYQLLLLQKIASWTLVIVVVGIAFASELGSIVTFAGLLTAGIAVAMQSVLVSMVGYFFLIGKYGIKVGDRIQIGSVSGEVIDLGLVRMYVLELADQGLQRPTGRVVAFANSVVFQVSSGLFKQIPGIDFGWHEITLTLPAGVDYAAVKEKLAAALADALKDYHDEILRQTQEIQKTTALGSGGDAHSQVQLQFSSSGVQAHIRYPVRLRHAAEVDERVSQQLLGVISTLQPG